MNVAIARDVRPPLILIKVMNPVMRILLRTPLGRLVRPFALLEFRGRRSGRLFRVPVGWHAVDAGRVVITPAAWRANFRDGLPVTVWYHGTRTELTGVLDDDPDNVAGTLRSMAGRSGSLHAVGIDIPKGHTITAADVAHVDRAAIHFSQG